MHVEMKGARLVDVEVIGRGVEKEGMGWMGASDTDSTLAQRANHTDHPK